MENKKWDGQGAGVEMMWNGETFISFYDPTNNYVSRYTNDGITTNSSIREDGCEITEKKFGEGDVFTIITETFSSCIEDTVKVINGELICEPPRV